VLDRAYHDCNHGFEDGSCATFVDSFRQLVPEYDCQRPFDATPDRSYVVPAIWLAGDGALEDYVDLLYRLASPKKMFSSRQFRRATSAARTLFGSGEFRRVLDGYLAERYVPLSQKMERRPKQKGQ
jgi:hypothetical protein